MSKIRSIWKARPLYKKWTGFLYENFKIPFVFLPVGGDMLYHTKGGGSMTREAALEASRGRVREEARASAAKPLTLYRVFWLFLIAGVAGDIIEVVFWLVTRGELISRSSLVYGPFSLVWGLGAVLLTLAFHRMDDQSAARTVLAGAVLGGAYEYICSWVQEALFGACFWDYRHLPFNLNGRVNLVFCLFWGLAALVWVRAAYPVLCLFIDRVPRRRGRRMVRAAALFLACSTVLSAAALCRMDQRRRDVPASGRAARLLDEVYPDSWLKTRYPNMGILDEIGW